PRLSSCSCVPCSCIDPSASTRIRSAMRTVENRWEISIAMRARVSSLNRWNTSYSARASSVAVGSSRISNCGSRYVSARQSELLPLAPGQIHATLETPAHHLVVPARQTVDHTFGQALHRRGFHKKPVVQSIDLAKSNVLTNKQ